MSRKWRDSDGPTLLGLLAAGFAMGIFIALISLGHNKHALIPLLLIGGALVGLCGGISMNSQGPVRAALVVFASIGVGMITIGVCAMQ
jgi:hypothetical protein